MNNLYLLLGALVVLLLLRLLARRFLARIGAKALARQPDSIHLRPMSPPAWFQEEKVTSLATPLLRLGFIDAGGYQCPEMPGLRLWMLVLPAKSICATIYDHPRAGVWLDMYCRYQDGTGLTYATSRDPGLAQRPERPIIYRPEATPEEVYQELMAKRPNLPLVSIGAANLPKFYEDTYAESIAWRKQRGINAEEVAAASRQRRQS